MVVMIERIHSRPDTLGTFRMVTELIYNLDIYPLFQRPICTIPRRLEFNRSLVCVILDCYYDRSIDGHEDMGEGNQEYTVSLDQSPPRTTDPPDVVGRITIR